MSESARDTGLDCLDNRASALIDCIYFVRWEPEVGSDADILALIERLRVARERISRPLHYCAVCPLYVPSPTAGIRKLIVARTPQMLQHTESIEVVADGVGVSNSLMRAITRGMVLAGGLRGKVFIHDTMASVLDRLHRDLTMPRSKIVEAVKSARVIE